MMHDGGCTTCDAFQAHMERASTRGEIDKASVTALEEYWGQELRVNADQEYDRGAEEAQWQSARTEQLLHNEIDQLHAELNETLITQGRDTHPKSEMASTEVARHIAPARDKSRTTSTSNPSLAEDSESLSRPSSTVPPGPIRTVPASARCRGARRG